MSFLKSFDSKSDIVLSILFILIVPALVSGPFLPDTFLSLIAFIFLIKTFFNRNLLFYYNKKFSLFFLLFFLTILFSSVLSEKILTSFESSLFYFRFYFFSIGVFYLLTKYDFLKKYFLFFSLITLCFLSIDSIYQYFNKFSLFLSLPIQNMYRASSLFQEELKLGNFIVRLLPLISSLFILYLGKNKLIPLIVLFSFSILVTGERTALVLLILFLIGIFLLNLNLKKFILTLTFLIAIFSIIFLTDNNIKQRMFIYTYDQIFDNNSAKMYYFSEQHTGHYESAIKMFMSNPIIGIGPKMFREECEKSEYDTIKYACTTHPHNTYIQLLAETGFIGFAQIFLLFIYICYSLLKLIIKRSISRNEEVFYYLLLSLFINLWPIVPTFNFFNNWINVVFYLPVGFLLYFNNQLSQNKNV